MPHETESVTLFVFASVTFNLYIPHLTFRRVFSPLLYTLIKFTFIHHHRHSSALPHTKRSLNYDAPQSSFKLDVIELRNFMRDVVVRRIADEPFDCQPFGRPFCRHLGEGISNWQPQQDQSLTFINKGEQYAMPVFGDVYIAQVSYFHHIALLSLDPLTNCFPA